MPLTVEVFREKSESAHLERLLVFCRLESEGRMCSKPVLHHLVNLASPAFKAI